MTFVPNAVRRRAVQSAAHPIQHIANVAHERVRYRRRVHPRRPRFDLQAGVPVLPQNGQQAVVGVFSHAPRGLSQADACGVMKDSEQDGGVCGVVPVEIVNLQS